jgi:hypothetical protein
MAANERGTAPGVGGRRRGKATSADATAGEGAVPSIGDDVIGSGWLDDAGDGDSPSGCPVFPSTVSRALTKLASWGLIAYVVGRGRWAGLVIFRRATDDGMERFRKAAQARVRRWSEAVRRRLSRLEFNVAPIALEGDRGVDSLYYWSTQVTNYKGATLTVQLPWTVEELRDSGII